MFPAQWIVMKSACRLDVDVGIGDESLDELLGLEESAVDLAGHRPFDHQVERGADICPIEFMQW